LVRPKYIPAAEVAGLIELNESISKMIRRWQSTLDVPEPRTRRAPRTRRRIKDQGWIEDQGRTKD
jgi:hypothetical protein